MHTYRIDPLSVKLSRRLVLHSQIYIATVKFSRFFNMRQEACILCSSAYFGSKLKKKFQRKIVHLQIERKTVDGKKKLCLDAIKIQ